jgi:hypothetical protein
MTPLFLSDSDVRGLLAWPDVIACLRAAYANLKQPDSAPPRVNARLGKRWLRALNAIPAGNRHMGAKLIARAETRGGAESGCFRLA